MRTPNLMDMTFFRVKKMALEICGKTPEELAEETGIGPSSVKRHFSEANYNVCPAHLILLCKAMDNYLQIEWMVIQIGGTMSMLDITASRNMNLSASVSKTLRKSADVLKTWSATIEDGIIDADEASEVDQYLSQLIKRATESRQALKLRTSRKR